MSAFLTKTKNFVKKNWGYAITFPGGYVFNAACRLAGHDPDKFTETMLGKGFRAITSLQLNSDLIQVGVFLFVLAVFCTLRVWPWMKTTTAYLVKNWKEQKVVIPAILLLLIVGGTTAYYMHDYKNPDIRLAEDCEALSKNLSDLAERGMYSFNTGNYELDRRNDEIEFRNAMSEYQREYSGKVLFMGRKLVSETILPASDLSDFQYGTNLLGVRDIATKLQLAAQTLRARHQ